MNNRWIVFLALGTAGLAGLGWFAWQQSRNRDEFSEELLVEALESSSHPAPSALKYPVTGPSGADPRARENPPRPCPAAWWIPFLAPWPGNIPPGRDIPPP